MTLPQALAKHVILLAPHVLLLHLLAVMDLKHLARLMEPMLWRAHILVSIALGLAPTSAISVIPVKDGTYILITLVNPDVMPPM